MKNKDGHPGCSTHSCTVLKPCFAYSLLLPGLEASTQHHLPCSSATSVACKGPTVHFNAAHKRGHAVVCKGIPVCICVTDTQTVQVYSVQLHDNMLKTYACSTCISAQEDLSQMA